MEKSEYTTLIYFYHSEGVAIQTSIIISVIISRKPKAEYLSLSICIRYLIFCLLNIYHHVDLKILEEEQFAKGIGLNKIVLL